MPHHQNVKGGVFVWAGNDAQKVCFISDVPYMRPF